MEYTVGYPKPLWQRPMRLPDWVSARGPATHAAASPSHGARNRVTSDRSGSLPGGRPSQAGSGKSGFRFAMNASAPSTMSSLPTAWVSIPSPVRNESRAAFHQMFELILVISR